MLGVLLVLGLTVVSVSFLDTSAFFLSDRTERLFYSPDEEIRRSVPEQPSPTGEVQGNSPLPKSLLLKQTAVLQTILLTQLIRKLLQESCSRIFIGR